MHVTLPVRSSYGGVRYIYVPRPFCPFLIRFIRYKSGTRTVIYVTHPFVIRSLYGRRSVYPLDVRYMYGTRTVLARSLGKSALRAAIPNASNGRRD